MERKLLNGDWEEIALILSGGEGHEDDEKGGELGKHFDTLGRNIRLAQITDSGGIDYVRTKVLDQDHKA